MRAHEFIIESIRSTDIILQEIISDKEVQDVIDPFVTIPTVGGNYWALMLHISQIFGEKILGISKSTNSIKISKNINGIAYFIGHDGVESPTIGSAYNKDSTDMITMFFETESDMEFLISHILLKYKNEWDISVEEMTL